MPSRVAAGALRASAAGLNAAGRVLAKIVGRGVPHLDADALVAVAQRRVGRVDFGPGEFREPLERLIESFERDAHLDQIGRFAAYWDLRRLLETRLRLQVERHLHPEIEKQEIRRPIFVTGLPRSGTTLLHGLLAADPAARAPLHWECLFPSLADAREQERRIRRCERQLRWFDALNPAMRRIHPLGATRPEECLILTSYSLRSFQFETTHDVASYQAWLEFADLRAAYEEHRRLLQHLQWQRPGEWWVLKAPAHLFGIDAINSVYPDAGIVFTHRDPLEVVASNASLHAVLRRSFSHSVDRGAVAREMTLRWAEGMRRALAVRAADPRAAERYFDVDYADLLADPIGVVRAIYAHYGRTLSAAAERGLHDFLARNPKDAHGRHRYTLEAFGLDQKREMARYAAYHAQFRREGLDK